MASVMEIIVRAQDQASSVMEGIGDTAGSVTEDIEVNWNAVAGATAAAGAGMEALARSQQDTRAVAGRLGNTIEGETTDSVMGLAAEVHDATRDLDEMVAMMETGSQQGLESGQDLQDYAVFWDTVGDATGESAAALAESSAALRAVGVAAGQEKDALGAFGFIAQETTGSVNDFLQFIDRVGPELREMGADVDDAAAVLGVMEHELGMSGRTARQEFRRGITESDGSLEGLLDTLGIGQEVFADYRGQVDESTGVIEANAEAFKESRTVTQELWADLEALGARFSGVLAAADGLASGMMAAGGVVFGINQIRQIAPGATRHLGRMAASFRTVGGAMRAASFAGAAAGVLLLVDTLQDARSEAAMFAEEIAGGFEDPERQLRNVRHEINNLQDDVAEGARIDWIPGVSLFSDNEAKHAQNQLDALEDKEAALELQMKLTADAAAKVAGEYVDMADALDSGLTPAEASARRELGLFTGATEENTDAAVDNAEAIAESTDATLDYIDAQRAAVNPMFALFDAFDRVEQATEAYNDTLDDNGNRTADSEAAAVDLAKALAGAEAAAMDGDLSFEDFSDQLDIWIEAGIITADKAAAIRDRVAEARSEVDRFEGGRQASIDINIEGLQQLREAGRLVDRVTGRSDVAISGTTQGGFIEGTQRRAAGGPFGPGWLLTGEDGPELMHVKSGVSGEVFNTSDTQRMLGGSGGRPFGPGGDDGALLAELRAVRHALEAGQVLAVDGEVLARATYRHGRRQADRTGAVVVG